MSDAADVFAARHVIPPAARALLFAGGARDCPGHAHGRFGGMRRRIACD
jgi:hypothetical protein